MGAGASTDLGALQGFAEASSADVNALANNMLPAAKTTSTAKEIALHLKMALSTKEGWSELFTLFKSLRPSLDDAVSSDEWGAIVANDEEIREKYFGSASPDVIAQQLDRLDEDGKTEMVWEEFVDGAISLGAAVELADALCTEEGELELKAIFDTIEPEPDGRIPLREFGFALKDYPESLARFTGLDANTSTRFTAFFMTGRVNAWLVKIFRRLGFNEDDYVNWDEFCAGGRATGSS